MPKVALAAAVAALACAACGAGESGGPAPRPPSGAPASIAAPATTPPPRAVPITVVPATGTAEASAGAPGTDTAPAVDPGTLPPTSARPTEDGQFSDEMALLWQAVTTGQSALAAPAFFPETAYVQLKALRDDRADWTQRLLAHLDLDIAAAHRLLGPRGATLVGVDVGPARYIRPGACDNRLGYWFTPGARMVYALADGSVHSFGIAALDGWRGEWYVVHLGTEEPPPGRGVVDAPTTGRGVPGYGGGC